MPKHSGSVAGSRFRLVAKCTLMERRDTRSAMAVLPATAKLASLTSSCNRPAERPTAGLGSALLLPAAARVLLPVGRLVARLLHGAPAVARLGERLGVVAVEE